MDLERFFHVAVKTDDLDAAVTFYRDVLGGELLESGDAGDGYEYAAFSVADKRIYCFEKPPYEIDGLVEGLPTGILHFGFVVPDVEAVVAELEEIGTELFMTPSTFGDLRIAFVYGPDGELIEFIEKL